MSDYRGVVSKITKPENESKAPPNKPLPNLPQQKRSKPKLPPRTHSIHQSISNFTFIQDIQQLVKTKTDPNTVFKNKNSNKVSSPKLPPRKTINPRNINNKKNVYQRNQKVRTSCDYEAKEEGELSFKKGTIVTLTNQKNNEWWEGTIDNSKQGIVNSRMVEYITETYSKNYESKSQTDNEIEEKKLKRITVKVDEESLQNSQDFFFQDHKEDQLARAKLDFKGEEDSGFYFSKGDILVIYGQIGDQVQGENSQGYVDYFPLDTIEYLDKNQNVMKENPFSTLSETNMQIMKSKKVVSHQKVNERRDLSKREDVCIPEKDKTVNTNINEKRKKRITMKIENEEQYEYDPDEDHEGDPKVRAICDYTAQNNSQLSFTKGTIIYVTGMNESGWWQGETRDFLIGNFNSKMVEFVENEENKSQVSQISGINFKLNSNNENKPENKNIKINQNKILNTGINIDINEKEKQKLTNKSVINDPIQRIENTLKLIRQSPFQKVQEHFVKALYKFDSKQQGDLSFREGEVLIAFASDKSGWIIGENYDGKIGIFPANYVITIDEEFPLKKYKAIQNFELKNIDFSQFSFLKDEIFVFMYEINNDWIYAKRENDQKEGYIQKIFLEEIN
ncbi:jak pathway signal transduction adaptor molecule [Anaeramoeba flamelloides]|uniref:Jak pathway signal transduction adaptor molecule n=1 Tax=Anaeramoeba flamelloides TaxID=1746091 RepID=A0AAV7YAA5_9EUKA|nr:jak pathway signal transduction adaptor molecule [Anaeramoeba flamelloides]